MNNKKIIVLCILLLPLSIFAQDKAIVLPSLELESNVSKKVEDFLKEETKTEMTENVLHQVKKVTYDILGRERLKKDTTAYLVKQRDKKMKVYISYLDFDTTGQNPIVGRFEINAQKGLKNIWLNNKKVSDKEFDELIKKMPVRKYKTPGYVEELTANQIKAILNGSKKVLISEYKEPQNFMRYDSILTRSQITTHAFANNYFGTGIGVYFTETGCPHLANVNTNYYIQGNTCAHGVKKHPTGVTRILQATAPQAKIYGYDQNNYPDPNSVNPKIEIGSHSWGICYDDEYCSEDMNMDNYIYNNRIINFVAAGNKNSTIPQYWVTSPGKALNAITVGAVTPYNNLYASYSMWKNSEIGNQKPELANYTDFYFPNDYIFTDNDGNTYTGYFAGTSASTPYSAGIAANLLQQYPFFKGHPELFKALLISGEKITIGNASTFDMDNDSYVVRGVPVYSSLAWNHRFRLWNGNNSCCFDSQNKITFTESDIAANKHYRIAIAWLTPGSYIYVNKNISQDIELYVYQNGSLIASSLSSKNPFEVVDFITTSNNDLQIVIKRFSNSGVGDVALGYSFWNDN